MVKGKKMAKIKGASKVTTKFQITLPQQVRKLLRVKAGDTIAFAEENGKIFIVIEIQ